MQHRNTPYYKDESDNLSCRERAKERLRASKNKPTHRAKATETECKENHTHTVLFPEDSIIVTLSNRSNRSFPVSIKQTDQVRAPTTQSTHINTPSSAAEELQQHTHTHTYARWAGPYTPCRRLAKAVKHRHTRRHSTPTRVHSGRKFAAN